MDEIVFERALIKLGISLNQNQKNQFQQYYQMLVEWNQKVNLTAITVKQDIYLKHFYDSLTLIKVIDLNMIHNICDVGTGAGFPGVVLKIVYPHLQLTLVDSLQKRILFLQELCQKLQLSNVEFEHARAEDYGRKNREKFDLVVARAVAPLPILLEYTIPLVKVGKYFIAMKGDISREIINGQKAIKELSIKVLKTEQFLLPIEGSQRSLVLFHKEKETNLTYPRKPEQIKKKPLISNLG